jgi:hypothetical protein
LRRARTGTTRSVASPRRPKLAHYFRSDQRRQEMVFYDFLHRLYDARAARARTAEAHRPDRSTTAPEQIRGLVDSERRRSRGVGARGRLPSLGPRHRSGSDDGDGHCRPSRGARTLNRNAPQHEGPRKSQADWQVRFCRSERVCQCTSPGDKPAGAGVPFKIVVRLA